MNFDNKLDLITCQEQKNRQKGRTEAMIEAVRRTPNAVLVTQDFREADRVEKKYDITAISVHQLDKIRGTTSVLIYDPSAVAALAAEAKESAKKEQPTSIPASECVDVVTSEMARSLGQLEIFSDEQKSDMENALSTFAAAYNQCCPQDEFQVCISGKKKATLKLDKSKVDFNTLQNLWPKTFTISPDVEFINIESYSEPIRIYPADASGTSLGDVRLFGGTYWDNTNQQNDHFQEAVEQIRQEEDRKILETIEKCAQETAQTGGSYCQKCNEFNEYISDSSYICYSCRH